MFSHSWLLKYRLDLKVLCKIDNDLKARFKSEDG